MFSPHALQTIHSDKERTYAKLKLSLTQLDEHKILAYHLSLLSKIIQQTQLPLRVQGTAFTYFRRFYLQKSLYSSNPQ